MNPLLSISLRLLFFVTLWGSSFPILYAQTQAEFLIPNDMSQKALDTATEMGNKDIIDILQTEHTTEHTNQTALDIATEIGNKEAIDILQTDDISQVLATVLSQTKQFPYIAEEVLKRPFPNIQTNHAKLVEALKNDTAYLESIENRPPLLTLEINTEVKTGGVVQFKVVKENFISGWGQELSTFVSEYGLNNSQQILNEISKILSDRPYLATTPHDFVSALVQTLDRNVNREEIFLTLERGDISILEEVLDSYPKGRGFKPKTFALEEDRGKEYYLGVLRDMMEMNERMNQLFASYILAFKMETELGNTGNLERYLIELNEESLVWIMEKYLQKDFTKKIVDMQDEKSIRRRILFRIKSIEREIKRHQEIVTEHAQVSENKLTLVEVHPSLGIFRGYIGGDCSTTRCFGYPYSPEERVFFILNKRGEDVGYLNGTIVNTNDGKKAFLVSGLAGAKISKEMSTIIFAGLSKAHRELGVEEVLILGREELLFSNLDYTEIRRAFDSHAGTEVPVTFLDRRFRDIIDKYSERTVHDDPDILSTGHRIENIEEIREGTHITVSERPFESPQLSDFKPSDLNPKEIFLINFKYPNIAQEWEIDLFGEHRSLRDFLQNTGTFPTQLYMNNLKVIRIYSSLFFQEFHSLIKYDNLRGLVIAPDFFSSPYYDFVIEDLEEAIAEAKDPENLRDYIINVFPYVRGKKLGEIVERFLDFVIENKGGNELEWFASDVFPHIRVPNKARMIEKTIEAAKMLNQPEILIQLSFRTLPRIRIPQRIELIEQVRLASIELKHKESLLVLGYYNNLGDVRGWRILQSLRNGTSYRSDLFANPNSLTSQNYEQQLEILRDYFSLTPEQFSDFFELDELRGRIRAEDLSAESLLTNPAGRSVIELLERAVATAKFPLDLQDYIIGIFPHAHGKKMGEIMEKALDFVIENNGTNQLEWFAARIFPQARVPNKAKMIEKTIRAAVTLKKPRILIHLSERTLPRIRIPQRRELIEQMRLASIELKDIESLLTLGHHNNLGNERGWQIMQSARRLGYDVFTKSSFSPQDPLQLLQYSQSTQDYEQQLEILRDYFSLTPEQFFDLFGTRELMGRMIAIVKDGSAREPSIKKILNLMKRIIDLKDPLLLQLLSGYIFPFFHTDGFWEDGVLRTIKTAIEIKDFKTLENLERKLFSRYAITESLNQFSLIRALIHSFVHYDKDWEKLRRGFQAVVNERSEAAEPSKGTELSEQPCFY